MKKVSTPTIMLQSFALLMTAGLLGACESLPRLQQSTTQTETPSGSTSAVAQNQPPASLRQFTDIPVPVNADLDKDATMVFGSGDQWIGRLVFSTNTDSFDLFQQYRQGFPQFGWQEITSLRSKVSIITYTREDRVATVQIEPSTLYGARVEISMSPRGGATSDTTKTPSARPLNDVTGPSGTGGGSLTVNPGRSPYQPAR